MQSASLKKKQSEELFSTNIKVSIASAASLGIFIINPIGGVALKAITIVANSAAVAANGYVGYQNYKNINKAAELIENYKLIEETLNNKREQLKIYTKTAKELRNKSNRYKSAEDRELEELLNP